MEPIYEQNQFITRRHFLGKGATGLGAAALASLLNIDSSRAASGIDASSGTHFAPRAKRVIYLFQSGGPSQMDLFDHKPNLKASFGKDLPESVRMGQRLTGMTAYQDHLPIAPSAFHFRQHGESGAWVSELMPHTAKIVDDLCFVRSMQTDAINHDPAMTFFMTGSQQAGRPSMGSWLSYGLGKENEHLPAFVVMTSIGTGRPNDQPLYDRLWGSGFIPSRHQGVRLLGTQDRVPYLSNPPGFENADRRKFLDTLGQLNHLKQQQTFDPEIETRISQYEMAFRMQTSVPELADFSDEPESTFDLYGPDSRKPGTYAANCLLARRMAERGVRFIQLFHRGWDQHTNLPKQLPGQCRDTDQPSAALVQDLKARGLLDDTLVIWGGEFGRTVYCQEELTNDNYGRDHHPRCFTIWMAGGGVKRGLSYGQSCDFCYNVVENPVSVHDLHATLLHQLGLNHERLTYRYQGRDFRLTDVAGTVVKDLLA